MLARIIDNKTIFLEQITPVEESFVIEEFSAVDPKARYIDTNTGFDGVYRKYYPSQRKLSRAFLGDLRRLCNNHQLPLSIVDERPPPQYVPDYELINENLLDGITLTDYQLRSLKAVCSAEVGLIWVTTGGGKSELIAGITKLFNSPTVIIAEQTIVVKQLKDRLELRQVVEEVGLFMAGKRPNGQTVIVGSIDSLIIPPEPELRDNESNEKFAKRLRAFQTRRKNARILRDMVGKCDLLLVDEADKATSKKYTNLFRYWFNGRRKYGFSGTFFDSSKPVQNLKLRENLGNIIAKATREEVQAHGRIVPVEYYAIVFGDPLNRTQKVAYDIAVKEQMIENVKFHSLINKLAVKSTNNGSGALILAENIVLGKQLELIIPDSKYIYGSTSLQERDSVIKRFEDRTIKHLIGSKIVRRGLDLKGGCETLIIATDVQMWSEFDQMIGRSLRLNNAGKARVYDIFHLNNYYLYKHSRDRLKYIVQMGYEAKVVFPKRIINAADFIKSRFKIDKNKLF